MVYKESVMFRLRNRLLLIFVGLAVGPLIVVTAILSRYTYDTLQHEALDSQSGMAKLVGTEIETFVQSRENELQLITDNIDGAVSFDSDEQNTLMAVLLSRQPLYQELALLDQRGQEQLRLSRTDVITDGDLLNRAEDEVYLIPVMTHAPYYSPVHFDDESYEPLMTIAVPAIDPRVDEVYAILVAEFRFKAIWNLMAGLKPREGEDIYLIDSAGRVVAHQNPSVVLKGTTLDIPAKDGRARGLSGHEVILAAYHMRFGSQEFDVVVEQSVSEAFKLALNMATVALVTTVIALVIAIILVTASVYQIVRPIVTLVAAARAISAGDMSQRVDITSRDEIGELATAFNRMTERLARMWADMERQVDELKQAQKQLHERATRLELVAQVGQQTTAILDLDDLLHRAAHLIGDMFHYYNVSIRLVEGDQVVLRAATLSALRPLEGHHGYPIGLTSISGWVAEKGEPLLVPDISQDERYAFVIEGIATQSKLAVPIKSKGVVIGVLDVQSTERNAFSQADELTLQIVADQLAIAIENAQLYQRVQTHAAELEQRVNERTAELAAVNKELEAFAYSVSHDLRTPLRSINGFSQAILEDYYDKLDAEGQDFLRRVRAASARMSQLIDDLLNLSQISRYEMHYKEVDLGELAREIVRELREDQPEHRVDFVVAESIVAYGDERLLRVVLENLLGNAWKFTAQRPLARIEFGYTEIEGQTAYFVRDNGAGFEMAYANRLFGAFQRLHTEAEFEGTGIGLATVQRIIHRHGGRVWAEGMVDQGATFYFTL
jgi:signal transduction histidine kinase